MCPKCKCAPSQKRKCEVCKHKGYIVGIKHHNSKDYVTYSSFVEVGIFNIFSFYEKKKQEFLKKKKDDKSNINNENKQVLKEKGKNYDPFSLDRKLKIKLFKMETKWKKWWFIRTTKPPKPPTTYTEDMINVFPAYYNNWKKRVEQIRGLESLDNRADFTEKNQEAPILEEMKSKNILWE